jgi:hypothetical protein
MSDGEQTYHQLTGPEGEVLGLVTRYEGVPPKERYDSHGIVNDAQSALPTLWEAMRWL